jgi:hypothetical protein
MAKAEGFAKVVVCNAGPLIHPAAGRRKRETIIGKDWDHSV